MSKEIAVLLDENGFTTSSDKPGIVKVFSKCDRGWLITKEISFSIDPAKGLKSVRDNLSSLVEVLDSCRIFVGKAVTGVAYTVLDSNGFNTWEFEGEPNVFLDYVFQKEQEEMESEGKPITEVINTSPIETDEAGSFYLNLKELQEKKSSVTSKQALLPFLREGRFYKLEVICAHIPPWLPVELETLDYRYLSSNIAEHQVLLQISKKTCNE